MYVLYCTVQCLTWHSHEHKRRHLVFKLFLLLLTMAQTSWTVMTETALHWVLVPELNWMSCNIMTERAYFNGMSCYIMAERAEFNGMSCNKMTRTALQYRGQREGRHVDTDVSTGADMRLTPSHPLSSALSFSRRVQFNVKKTLLRHCPH